LASLSNWTPLNTLLLIVFIIIFIIAIHNRIRTQRNWGILASKNKPHSNSITRIFNTDKKLTDTLVSYKNMKFGFPENPKGEYQFEITTDEYDLAKTQKAGKVSKQRISISNQGLNKRNIIKLKQE
ncbi:hypothetical protein KC909_03115, partial [Candidatus Dojkabacteria bacterium]|nr:hypothetical protein [Candidatus Dojkabacteria bacterium]